MNSNLKVPHMGWNNLEISEEKHPILKNITEKEQFYFVHSYRAQPKFDDVITAESDYGVKIPAVVEKNNFFGTQFHPEKSLYEWREETISHSEEAIMFSKRL